jgi:Fe2+ transport system protein FeoA
MSRFAPFSNRKAKQQCRKRTRAKHCQLGNLETTLADINPGCTAKITGFCRDLSKERCSHFQAYGLVPGNIVKVLQHSPVTVIQIDHTELAMELELACEIQVVEDSFLFSS